jgi:hypothetical protein
MIIFDSAQGLRQRRQQYVTVNGVDPAAGQERGPNFIAVKKSEAAAKAKFKTSINWPAEVNRKLAQFNDLQKQPCSHAP